MYWFSGCPHLAAVLAFLSCILFGTRWHDTACVGPKFCWSRALLIKRSLIKENVHSCYGRFLWLFKQSTYLEVSRDWESLASSHILILDHRFISRCGLLYTKSCLQQTRYNVWKAIKALTGSISESDVILTITYKAHISHPVPLQRVIYLE